MVAASAALFVPYSDNMFVDRLGITLAILLTLVFFTQERPAVIEHIPYPTMHDQFEKWMVFLVVMICVENMFVYTFCFGVYGPNEIYDLDIKNGVMEERDPELNGWWCEATPQVGMARVDQLSLVFVYLSLIHI